MSYNHDGFAGAERGGYDVVPVYFRAGSCAFERFTGGDFIQHLVRLMLVV